MPSARFSILCITAITDFSAALFLFTVHRSVAEAESSALTLGLLGGSFSGAMALSTYFAGRVSDRVGRFTVLVIGNLLFFPCVACVAMTEFGDGVYYLAYTCAGASLGATFPSLIALLTNNSRESTVTQSLIGFCLAWNTGMICGYASGGYLYGRWGPMAPLVCAMLLLPVNLLMVFWARRQLQVTYPLPNKTTAPREKPSELGAAFAVLGWVANIGGTCCISTVIFLLPKLAVQIDMAPEAHGSMVAFSRVMVIATYLHMFFLSYWRFRFSSGLAAQITAILGLFCMAGAQTEFTLVLGLAAMSVLPGYNYFASLYYSTIGSTDEHRGRWSGIHEATFGVGLALGSIGGGLVGNHFGVRSAFILAAVVVALLAGIQVVMFFRLVLPLLKANAGGTR